MNRIILIGNLGQDAELKTTPGGQQVLSMRIATSEKYTDKKTNEKKELTEWFTCDLWGDRGPKLAEYLTKGTKIAIEGSVHTRTVESDDGTKRYFTSVKVSNLEFVGGAKKGTETTSTEDSDGIPF